MQGEPASASAQFEPRVPIGHRLHGESGGTHVGPRGGVHSVNELRTGLNGSLSKVSNCADPATDAVGGFDDHDAGPALSKGPSRARPGHPRADHDDVGRFCIRRHHWLSSINQLSRSRVGHEGPSGERQVA